MKCALLMLIVGTVFLIARVRRAEASDPVKVFILAGQSNMEGHGQISSLDHLGEHPEYGHLLNSMRDSDGDWRTRDDVTVYWAVKDPASGPLTVGWGASENEVGPEGLFGAVMGDKHDAHVLLIKTAWGGSDVYCDFRSPSAGDLTEEEAVVVDKQRADGRDRDVGGYYRQMVSEVRACLANIENVVPGYDGQGYDIAGMAWLQGWNDYCEWHLRVDDRPVGTALTENYAGTLAAMFTDLRSDLDAPDMPIVVGEMGVGGEGIATRAENPDDREARAIMAFRAAQKESTNAALVSNVAFVPTAQYWDARLDELRAISDKYWHEKRTAGIADTADNHLPTKALNEEY
ncbi:MAG: sialate O-acetylesterase, partial [Candidatus Poribacteria bacterium]